MNSISFIEDPPVVRKILKHLGMWEIKKRPPLIPLFSLYPPTFPLDPTLLSLLLL